MPKIARAGASMDSDALLADALRRIRQLEKRPQGSTPLGLLLGIGKVVWGSALWSTFDTDGSANFPSGASPTITVEDGDPDLSVGDGSIEAVEYLELAASNTPCLYVISGGCSFSSSNKGTHEVIDINMMITTDNTSLYSPNGIMRGAVIFGTSGSSTPSVGGMFTLPLPGAHYVLAQMGASSSVTTGTHITPLSYTLRVLRFSLPS